MTQDPAAPQATGPDIRLRTLGGSEVFVDERRDEFFDSRKLLFALLLVLAVERERSRDTLMGIFWPDRSPDRARRSLNQALYELRQKLGDHWLKTSGDLVRVNGFLACDLLAFEEAMGTGYRSVALRLFEGSFLRGFSARGAEFGHWAAGKRALVDRLARGMFKEEVNARLVQGELGEAIRTARRWVTLDPHDDEGQHRLIELLAASGDRTAALKRYELYRTLLLEDDLRPLEETEALMELVRGGQTADLGLGLVEEEPGTEENTRSGPPSSENRAGKPTSAGSPEAPLQPSGPTPGGTMRWVAGGIPKGPRLRRILPDGRPGEVLLLGRSKTVLGREEGDLTFPDDPAMAPAHAVILMRQAPADGGSGPARFFLRPATPEAEIFLRIRGSWPLRPGDTLVAGGLRLRLLP